MKPDRRRVLLVALGFAFALTVTLIRDAAATITVYPRVGSQTDSAQVPQGPGIVVMGGGSDVDGAFVWMHDTVAGSRDADGGDLVVLRATGSDAYDDYIAGLARFNSVRTLLIPTPASATDLATAADIVDQAEVVFFAGGNQAEYVGWKDTRLMASVAQLFQRGGIVGGTSAGAAILGEFIFDSVANTGPNVTSPEAVANPYDPAISFTRNLLPLGVLRGAITDTHFVARGRFGRLAAFMGRQIADGFASVEVHGIGVDANTAIVIDKNGIGTLKQFTQGIGGAFVITGGSPAAIGAGQPLVYSMLSVTRLDADGQTYDFSHWCGNTSAYRVTVDGATSPIYQPDNPYTAPGAPETCGGIDALDMGRADGPALPGNTSGSCRISATAAPSASGWLSLAGVMGIALTLRRHRHHRQ